MEKNEISRSHRVGKAREGKPRAIIVKFTSYRATERVFQARKENNNIFISEDLTRKRAHIMFVARGLKRSKRIHSVFFEKSKM